MGILRILKSTFFISTIKRIYKSVLLFDNKSQSRVSFEERFLNLSFSQEGEDLVLERMLGEKLNGFYVDIGAHHPLRFSNTYKFYLKGWTGINIDPLPGMKELFDKYRGNDINLNIGISNTGNLLNYYMFNEPALNTFSEQQAIIRDGLNNGEYFLTKQLKIETYRLVDVLDKYCHNKNIDFMTIDVEGFDFEVLTSNNWDKYSPKYLILEILNETIVNIINSDIDLYLNNKGYLLVSKLVNSVVYKRSKDLDEFQ